MRLFTFILLFSTALYAGSVNVITKSIEYKTSCICLKSGKDSYWNVKVKRIDTLNIAAKSKDDVKVEKIGNDKYLVIKSTFGMDFNCRMDEVIGWKFKK